MINEDRRTAIGVAALALVVLAALGNWVTRAQEQPRVAVEVSPGVTLLVSRADAVETLKLLDRHTLIHQSDVQLHGALQLALGDVGKPELHYGEGEETTAERKIREWSATGR